MYLGKCSSVATVESVCLGFVAECWKHNRLVHLALCGDSNTMLSSESLTFFRERLSESRKISRGSMYTGVNIHIYGVVRCNSAAQLCEVINLTNSECGSIEICLCRYW